MTKIKLNDDAKLGSKKKKKNFLFLRMNEIKIDFDFNNNCVKLYLIGERDIKKFKLLLLAYFVLISTSGAFFCFKKEQKNIKMEKN